MHNNSATNKHMHGHAVLSERADTDTDTHTHDTGPVVHLSISREEHSFN